MKPFKYQGGLRADGDDTPSNDERADAAQLSLDAFPQKFKDGDPLTEIGDLIADLLHLADRYADKNELVGTPEGDATTVLRSGITNWSVERSEGPDDAEEYLGNFHTLETPEDAKELTEDRFHVRVVVERSNEKELGNIREQLDTGFGISATFKTEPEAQDLATRLFEESQDMAPSILCRKCQEPYNEAGDGWDGLCPTCADKADPGEVEAPAMPEPPKDRFSVCIVVKHVNGTTGFVKELHSDLGDCVTLKTVEAAEAFAECLYEASKAVEATHHCGNCWAEYTASAEDDHSNGLCPQCWNHVDQDRYERHLADKYPMEEWQSEVSAGDTKLGYVEWIAHQKESNEG